MIETLKEDCIKWIEFDKMFGLDNELQISWKSLTKNEDIDLVKSVLKELSY